MKEKKSVINVGDLIHYCPVDLNLEHHDIGIVYDIHEEYNSLYGKNIKNYKILWARHKQLDELSETTMRNKLKLKIDNKYILKIIKCNEEKDNKTTL